MKILFCDLMPKYKSMEDVPLEMRKKLSKYFTNVGGDTFCITNLPSELTGGALARYSRAKTGMQLTIVNEFLGDDGEPSQAKGSALMDRVLNAYGDDSVGELEGVHVGIEDASQLLLKEIEDRRIGGSPIEQSTRYVKYDVKDQDGKWRYLRPSEIIKSQHGAEYEAVCDAAFEVYTELVEKLQEHFKKEFARESFTIQGDRDGKKVSLHEADLQGDGEEKAFRIAYNFTIRCAALDVGRCMLPSSTKSHVGIFGNGRFFTMLLNHLKTVNLSEAGSRAVQLETELNKVIPTFIKRNKKYHYVSERDERMRKIASTFETAQEVSDVMLQPKTSYIDEVIALSLYPYTSIPLYALITQVSSMSTDKKQEILQQYVGERATRRDRTGRGAEAGYPFTFDLIGTYAEYRDLQRHRMCTQQRQLLSVNLGFLMPPEIKIVGMDEKVTSVVQKMEVLHKKLRDAGLLYASQYATLFNHRIRWTMGMNLRELQHLVELRSGVNGHHGYRAIAMEMARQAIAREPWVEQFLGFVDFSDPGNKISRAKEQGRIQGKNLKLGVDGDFDY